MSQQPCDAVIIGSGPGGYVAALRIATMGGRATLVESRNVGGVCLNTGCIPTKALLHVSKMYAGIKDAVAMGITVDGASLDLAQAVAHKDKVVERLGKGLSTLLAKREVNLITGHGRIIDAGTVGVDSPDGALRISGRNVILATGTVPAAPPGIDIDGERVINTDQALNMRALPESILIVGAGAIGVESATMLAEMGSRVTLVEVADRILPAVDPEASNEVAKSLKKRKIAIHCGTKVESVVPSEGGVTSRLSGGREIETATVLVAIGRQTQIDGLGLDEVGIEHDGRFVKIDEHCSTNVLGVYAIGDITGKGPFAHVAYRQGTVAAGNIMGRPITEDYRIVPMVVYSHPELAQVGMDENAARSAGVEVEVGRFRYQASGAAQAYGRTGGLCKLIAEAPSRRIIGATIVGYRAGEVIHEVALAIRTGSTADQIAEMIHAHPTFAEPLAEAADTMLGMPLHSL